MRIDVLGPLRLSTDAGGVVDLGERKLRILLGALVAADGEPVPVDVMVDRLWGEHLPADPPKVLRAKLSRLRTALDVAEDDGRRLLRHTPAGYQLALDTHTVDASRFRAALVHARGIDSPAERAEHLSRALQLWRGDPYVGLEDEIWLAPVIADLHSLRGDTYELLAETLVADGRPGEAVDIAGGAVRSYPTRERLIASLMHALYQIERQDEALQTFEELRRRLAEDLGIDPGQRVRTLHERILRQDPGLSLPHSAAPSASALATASAGERATPRSNLPTETAPLIGRRRESRQIASLLAESRLITLTGVGGVGKTRLALHQARQHEEHVEGGSWFIDLTELSQTAESEHATGERIASLAVRVLDLHEGDSAVSTVSRVAGALVSRSVLLVLDNCEHVIDEVAAFVSELLARAPGVQVLATSREPLGLPEEQRFDVSTLHTEPEEGREVSRAAEFFAVRARATDPGFELDQSTTADVVELCRRLDGLPLALELAAARIRGISVNELLERLSDRLNLLHRPGDRAPRRQQTLRGMINWSWSLLNDAERAVLRRIAVHSGSIPLSAAEEICAGDSDDDSVGASQVLDVLISLVDRSMVRATSTPMGTRYGLLESIATYAAEKLDEAGERESTAHRHLSNYIELACEADRRLRGPDQRQWLAVLDAERTQLHNAFDEAVRRGDGAAAVTLTLATFWSQWVTGRQARLQMGLQRAIDLPGPHDDNYAAAVTYEVALGLHARPGQEEQLVNDALRGFSAKGVVWARTKWFVGMTLLSLGLRVAGEQHIDEGIGVLAAAGEDWDVAVAVSQRDWFLVGHWRETPRGMPDGRDPKTVLQELGDGWGLAQWLAVEQRTAELRGDHHRAADAAQRALGISLDFGLWGEAADFQVAMSLAALRDGDVPLALDRLKQARSLATKTGYEYALLTADSVWAMIARYQGDLPGAHAALENWMTDRGLEATQLAATHIEKGFLAVQQADPGRAREALEASRALLPSDLDAPITASVLELAAAIRAVGGAATSAAELLGSAESHRERAGTSASAPAMQDIDWVRNRISTSLPDEEIDAAIARGRTLHADRQLTAVLGPV